MLCLAFCNNQAMIIYLFIYVYMYSFFVRFDPRAGVSFALRSWIGYHSTTPSLHSKMITSGKIIFQNYNILQLHCSVVQQQQQAQLQTAAIATAQHPLHNLFIQL